MLNAIPPDGLLLHVGVFKTGTTALQETLRHSPEVLADHDVLYRGPSSWRFAALRTLAGADDAKWRALVADAAAHPGRRIISSENLCGCSDDEARGIVAALAADRPVHILLTVRTLADLLPSTWQQFLKRGMSEPYEQWVQRVVSDAETGSGVFWRRNDFPAQVRRWGALVGEREVTVVVSDKRDPGLLLRVTEQLLALPAQSLQFHPAGKSNESLSHDEAELLRRVNEAVFEELGGSAYHDLVRLGVFPSMHRARIDKAASIPLPEWAAAQMTTIGAQQAQALRGTGATLVGDIDALAGRPSLVAEDAAAPESIGMGAATAAVVGALQAAQRRRRTADQAPPVAQAQPRRWALRRKA